MNSLVKNLLIFGSSFSILGAMTYFGGIGDVNRGRGRTRLFNQILTGLADLLGSEQTVGIVLFVIGFALLVWAAVAWMKGPQA